MFNCDTRVFPNGPRLKYLYLATEDVVLCHRLLALLRYNTNQEEPRLGNGPFGVSWNNFGN